MELDGPRVAPASGGPARQVVLMLHGVGADGHDLINLAPELARVLPEATFISPHAPSPYDMAPMGRQWFSLRDLEPAAMLAGAEAAMQLLDTFIGELLAELGLADDRLALFGFSQGSMMSLHVGLRRRAACAGILGYSGMLLAGPDFAAGVARPPVLLVHGEADEVVPVACLAHAESALKRAGVEVEAHTRPHLGHGIDQEGLRLAAVFLGRCFGLV